MTSTGPSLRGTARPGEVLSVESLTKEFGSVRAVDGLSFTVEPGRVTGFLGPNGAGKTTTLRILLGLVAATRGRATIGGLRYDALPRPLRTVGASLEATGFHPGRTARNHLRVIAVTVDVPDARVDEVLDLVGLREAARRRVGQFSLGMRQRLALAAALLADPSVLVLDEPANGLDPEGIAWLRGLLRFLAEQGRTVLVSSHVLSEVQQTVQDVVIVARGRLVRQAPLTAIEGNASVHVRTPSPDVLATALAAHHLAVEPTGERGLLRVSTADPAVVGRIAFSAGVEIHELLRRGGDLEEIFLALTRDPGPPSPRGGLRAGISIGPGTPGPGSAADGIGEAGA